MSTIAPAILTDNADDYKASVTRYHEFTTRAHVDISDGEFAPTLTISENDVWWPQEWLVDIHAMVARPSEHMAALLKLKPHMVIFHAEASEDITPMLAQLKAADIKAGVALLRPTVPASVVDLIKAADHVMIFSGDLGKMGGTASLMQIEKVRLIKAINPNVEIGWDGGVNIENAFNLAQGGVDVVNVGATLAQAEDPKATYDTLVNEINKHGII